MPFKKLRKNEIENKILTIRGVQVILDKDLAEIYGVETRVLNQAVKRNSQRFPKNFRFQITKKELLEGDLPKHSNLRSHVVTSSPQIKEHKENNHGGSRYARFAFTEQGVAMLSSILRSKTAIKVSIEIMEAFVEMRRVIKNYGDLLFRIKGIEIKQAVADEKLLKVWAALEKNKLPPHQGIFFNGQVFDAYDLVSKIIRSAKKRIILIDNFSDENTVVHLTKKMKEVKVFLLTKNINNQLLLDIRKADEQYGDFKLVHFTKSHDRFLIIDDLEIYHLGASLKDLGKKWFAFSRLNKSSVENIVNAINREI